MKKKTFFVVGLLLLLMNTSYSLAETDDYFETNIFYRGDVFFELDKDSYAAGEEVKTDFTVANMENFPIIDAYLVIEVVEGGPERAFPSQNTETENIFYEEKIDVKNIPAYGKKTVSFSYAIPEELKAGEYRLEAYLKTKKTNIVGIVVALMSPQYRNFKVEGDGTFPHLMINRNLTMFANETGQIGPGVEPSEEVNGTVYVKSSKDAEGLTLKVSVCAWDDTSCGEDELAWSHDYPFSAKAGDSVKVPVSFNAPEKPDAYAIRLELLDTEGRTLSLYRSRLVVKGEKPTIRKMALEKAYLAKDEKGKTMLLLSASPDIYTAPVTKNAKVVVSIEDSSGKVYEDSKTISELSMESSGLAYQEFEFTAPKDLNEYKICSILESESGALFDRYCFDVKPDSSMLTENVIEITWTYDYLKSVLETELCARDVSGMASETSAAALLMDSNNELVDAKEGLALAPCAKAAFKTLSGDYRLLVNDLSTNKQTPTSISIEKKIVCGDGRCEEGESAENCCIDCGCPAGQYCKDGACTIAPAKEKPAQDNTLLYMVLGIIAVLVIIYALKMRGKK